MNKTVYVVVRNSDVYGEKESLFPLVCYADKATAVEDMKKDFLKTKKDWESDGYEVEGVLHKTWCYISSWEDGNQDTVEWSIKKMKVVG